MVIIQSTMPLTNDLLQLKTQEKKQPKATMPMQKQNTTKTTAVLQREPIKLLKCGVQLEINYPPVCIKSPPAILKTG